MEISRLDFLRGALASLGLSMLGGGPLFAAPPGWKPGGKPKLVLGVFSDTHLKTSMSGKKVAKGRGRTSHLENALKYFRDANVDAVVHCGDFAHRGLAKEIEFHAEVWRKIFPKNQAPDGHVVEKLFVTGNHDLEGSNYGAPVKVIYPDPKIRAGYVFATDPAAHWKRIWGEKYETVWHKVVKGYHFVGCQWDSTATDELIKFLKENKKLLSKSGKRHPFFLLKHSFPNGDVVNVLNGFDNGVCFHGHWHASAANWNMFRVKNGMPFFNCPSCEPRGENALVGDGYITKAKIGGRNAAGISRQGFVVRVYDDMLTIERREFGAGGSLGSDWVLPFDAADLRADMKKRIGCPQFEKNAKLKVESVKLEKGEDGVRVTIPLADGNPDSRVYAYEVAVQDEKGDTKLLKATYAAGVNMGIGYEPNKGITTIDIPKKQLPKGDAVTFSVCPLSSLGTRGNPITLKHELGVVSST